LTRSGLVEIHTYHRGLVSENSSEANLRDYRDQIQSLETVAAYAYTRLNFRGQGEPRRILLARTSAAFFPLLGVDPLIGRTHTPEEDQPGAEWVAVLSYGFWQRDFGGDPEVLGRSVSLEGVAGRIIGVMPPTFKFPHQEVEAWIPLKLNPSNPYARANHYLRVIGRLKNGLTVADAFRELAAYGRRVVEEFPQNGCGRIRSSDRMRKRYPPSSSADREPQSGHSDSLGPGSLAKTDYRTTHVREPSAVDTRGTRGSRACRLGQPNATSVGF